MNKFWMFYISRLSKEQKKSKSWFAWAESQIKKTKSNNSRCTWNVGMCWKGKQKRRNGQNFKSWLTSVSSKCSGRKGSSNSSSSPLLPPAATPPREWVEPPEETDDRKLSTMPRKKPPRFLSILATTRSSVSQYGCLQVEKDSQKNARVSVCVGVGDELNKV